MNNFLNTILFSKAKWLLGACIFLLQVNGFAQELTLENAMMIALKNNHNIQIQENQNVIAQNNVHRGNANLLPKVDLNGNVSASQSKTDIQFVTDPAPQTGLESESQSTSLKVQMSYTIFNGLANVKTYKKLQEQGHLSDIQTKLGIESTLMQVINSFYDVLRNQEQATIFRGSMAVSEDRLMRLQENYKYGSARKIDVLNAQVDFNSDSSNLINSLQSLENAQYNLNHLLGRAVTTSFNVSSQTNLESSVASYEESLQKSLGNNSNMLLAKSQQLIADLDMQISKSRYMPMLSTNVSYGYTSSESTPSVILSNSSLGVTGSLSLAWNLFDGNKRKSALENAEISIGTSKIQEAQAKSSIELELANYFGLLKTNLTIIDLETNNLGVAKLNLERSRELFNLGQIDNVQFRQAQLNLLNSQLKLNNALYSAKIMEYQIKRLRGELVSSKN
jgi:outer membrane protein TolC